MRACRKWVATSWGRKLKINGEGTEEEGAVSVQLIKCIDCRVELCSGLTRQFRQFDCRQDKSCLRCFSQC